MNYPEKDKKRIKAEEDFTQLLNKLGEIARQNGMTEEILNELLNEDKET